MLKYIVLFGVILSSKTSLCSPQGMSHDNLEKKQVNTGRSISGIKEEDCDEKAKKLEEENTKINFLEEENPFAPDSQGCSLDEK